MHIDWSTYEYDSSIGDNQVGNKRGNLDDFCRDKKSATLQFLEAGPARTCNVA